MPSNIPELRAISSRFYATPFPHDWHANHASAHHRRRYFQGPETFTHGRFSAVTEVRLKCGNAEKRLKLNYTQCSASKKRNARGKNTKPKYPHKLRSVTSTNSANRKTLFGDGKFSEYTNLNSPGTAPVARSHSV